MATASSINRNNNRKKLSKRLAAKRQVFKEMIYDKSLTLEDRFSAILKLSKLPRNSAKTRVRNRCKITGRPRGVLRKFGISRNMVRLLQAKGWLPGVVKASW